MDWMDALDEQFSSERRMDASQEAAIARDMVDICLNIMVRFSLGTGAEMRMLPNRWDVARYEGEKQWQLSDEFDFGQVGEILLVDQRPKGCALFSEFMVRRGFNHFRAGFILPERIGEESARSFHVGYEEAVPRVSMYDLWRTMRGGVASWYESLLRDDISPLVRFCEISCERVACPRIPGNL